MGIIYLLCRLIKIEIVHLTLIFNILFIKYSVLSNIAEYM
jgi:hypothetical protein